MDLVDGMPALRLREKGVVRCPSCGTWDEGNHRRCANCGNVLEPVPDYLWRAIVATLLFPLVGLVAVYFSVRTNHVFAGDYFEARRSSRSTRAWAHAVFWFGLGTILFFGIVQVLVAISDPPSAVA